MTLLLLNILLTSWLKALKLSSLKAVSTGLNDYYSAS